MKNDSKVAIMVRMTKFMFVTWFLSFSLSGFAQQRTLVGSVIDAANDDPLIGVVIQIKGQENTIGATTDLDGNFTIQVGPKTELIFSYMGYKTQTLIVGDLGVMTVKLQSENEMIDEVVVVGAGTQRKVSVTGSITAVKGTELRTASSSLTSGLAGKLAGLVSMTKSGKPGEGSEFYIRGIGTFGGRATPLILLDGVEITSAALDNLPPESIASFSILKDASATAIYGSRGANGVLIVTTKEGSENTKAQISASFEYSFNQPTREMQYVDGATYMELYNAALTSRYPKANKRYSQSMIDNTRSGINPYLYPDTDWYNLLFKDFAMNQRINLNVQGGGSRVTYYMSLQANHDTGLVNCPTDYVFNNNYNYWSYIFQNNINYKLTNTTKVSLKLNAQFGSQTGLGDGNSDLYYNVYDINPTMFPAFYPAQNGDDHVRFGNAVKSGSQLYINPYAKMLEQSKHSNSNEITASIQFDQDFDFITKGLKMTALVSLNAKSVSTYTSTMKPYYYTVIDPSTLDSLDEKQAEILNNYNTNPSYYAMELIGEPGTAYQTQSDVSRWSFMTYYIDARINYERKFGDHAVGAMLMYMMREYRENQLPNRNQGLSGRVTYDYKNRYLAEVNFGYNGTERLARKSRFEFFPAVSLGWVVSNEEFWKPIYPHFNHLKFRASYGLVGSDDTGKGSGAPHFLYVSDVTTYTPDFWTGAESEYNKGNAALISTYPIMDASWERARKLDVGVDFRLFNRVSVSFDYFHDYRDRILMRKGSWPQQMGYGNAVPWSNVGEAINEGVDMSINYDEQINENWNISLRGTFTYNHNKLKFVDEPDYAYSWQQTIGWPLGSYRTEGYIADGLFKDDDDIASSAVQNLGSTVMPGDIKYRDINGDGKITQEDRTMISDYGYAPRIQAGLGLYVRWKKLDVGVFFNGSAQRTIIEHHMNPFGADTGTEFDAGERQVAQHIADNRWTDANPDPNAKYPRLGVYYTDVKNNLQTSSYWMRDGSFIRFKTLEVGYEFPHVRVYFTGNNLWVWSPFKLWDPELSWNSYPLQRTFNLGVQVKF